MKKNLFYYLGAVLCAVMMFTSCSEDDKTPEAVCPVQAKEFTDASGLQLTYSGASMLGKKVSFTPDASNPNKATVVLQGDVLNVTGLLPASRENNSGLDMLKTSGVVPGEVTTTLNVDLVTEGDKVSFTGKDEKDGRILEYTGEATNSMLKLDVKVTMPANELTGKTLTILPAIPWVSSPFHIVWDADEFEIPGGTWDMNSALNLILEMTQIEGKTVPQLLTGVLNQITFLPDGNIQAMYKDTPDDAEWKPSALNLAMYKVGADNKIYLYLNVAQIMAEANKGRAADLSAILGNLLPAVLPMLSEGVPLTYTVEEDKVTVYLGYDVFKPVLAAVAPLFEDEALIESLLELLKAQAGDMAEAVDMLLKPILLQMPQIISTTTDVQIGLKFSMPSENAPAE